MCKKKINLVINILFTKKIAAVPKYACLIL